MTQKQKDDINTPANKAILSGTQEATFEQKKDKLKSLGFKLPANITVDKVDKFSKSLVEAAK